jgi:hypothetical protein
MDRPALDNSRSSGETPAQHAQAQAQVTFTDRSMKLMEEAA